MSEARGMSMKDKLISELDSRYGSDNTNKLVRYITLVYICLVAALWHISALITHLMDCCIVSYYGVIVSFV